MFQSLHQWPKLHTNVTDPESASKATLQKFFAVFHPFFLPALYSHF